ncbi:hypothetical protein IWQ57_001193 [Coemansia nantahalensis]|uniref:Uncharacterized protein n=1 Tax=Coemansia nantahalensis TaxID=2789366 RepID=A0ACC1K5F8_9FUNG|nr:hypothetical protein IWQ57_001193 [Coemansia nantahalensis]
MLVEKYPRLRCERWLPSVLRSIEKSSGAVFDERLLRGPRGHPLCLWCGCETSGASGELFCPPPRRGTRAGPHYDEGCEHEHRLRRDNQYVRKQLLARDGGVCAECGVDAHDLFAAATRCATMAERAALFKRLARVNPDWRKKVRRPLTSMDCGFTEGMFWEAAHVIDVKHGGGLCGLDGFHTLCVPCHADEYARSYIQDLSTRSPYFSPPPPAAAPATPAPHAAGSTCTAAALSAQKENVAPRPRTPTADDCQVILLESSSCMSSSSSALPSPQMPSPSRCLAARPPRHTHETPTKQQGLLARPRLLPRPPSPHLAAVIDLTAASSDPLQIYVSGSDLDDLVGKLNALNVSSSVEPSDDEVEFIAAISGTASRGREG